VYVQLADDLPRRSRLGLRRWHTIAQREAELSETYVVARMTVSRALDVLRERGLLRTVHGRRSVVVERPSGIQLTRRHRGRGEPADVSGRRLFAGLLAHHVLGIPVRPVRVSMADPRLMLPVRGRRPPHGLGQVAC
jgi:GntR family transcriptional regulator